MRDLQRKWIKLHDAEVVGRKNVGVPRNLFDVGQQIHLARMAQAFMKEAVLRHLPNPLHEAHVRRNEAGDAEDPRGRGLRHFEHERLRGVEGLGAVRHHRIDPARLHQVVTDAAVGHATETETVFGRDGPASAASLVLVYNARPPATQAAGEAIPHPDRLTGLFVCRARLAPFGVLGESTLRLFPIGHH